jgi:pimeloyl-ACP methyl ester carboxylesterase
MTTNSETTQIEVQEQKIDGTFLVPSNTVPGVLFIHGWGGSQQFDLLRAKHIAGMGCVCLTFDLRGHADTLAQQMTVSRDDNLRDAMAAYDCLVSHPAINTSAIAVVGSSYGGYLAALLTQARPVRWLALHVPALYRDDEWMLPKRQLNRKALMTYRLSHVTADDNRALAACREFKGDVLIVEAEHDTFVPHSTIMNYMDAFQDVHSLTYRIVDEADHALTEKSSQQAYTSILSNWTIEMVVGSRVGRGLK